MTYTLYYSVPVSDGTFAVVSEDYVSIAHPDPISDTYMVVSGNHPTQADADKAADYHQRQSYGKRRQENQHASQD